MPMFAELKKKSHVARHPLFEHWDQRVANMRQVMQKRGQGLDLTDIFSQVKQVGLKAGDRTLNAFIQEAAFAAHAALDVFDWPLPPKLSYNNAKDVRHARHDESQVVDAEIRFNVRISTVSGAKRQAVLPVTIASGDVVPPSTLLFEDRTYILGQSTINSIVNRNTSFYLEPLRKQYSAPLRNEELDIAVENRNTRGYQPREFSGQNVLTRALARRQGDMETFPAAPVIEDDRPEWQRKLEEGMSESALELIREWEKNRGPGESYEDWEARYHGRPSREPEWEEQREKLRQAQVRTTEERNPRSLAMGAVDSLFEGLYSCELSRGLWECKLHSPDGRTIWAEVKPDVVTVSWRQHDGGAQQEDVPIDEDLITRADRLASRKKAQVQTTEELNSERAQALEIISDAAGDRDVFELLTIYGDLLPKWYLISVAYEKWDEESLEIGETDDKGWEFEQDEVQVEDLIGYAQGYDYVGDESAHANQWRQEDEDIESGDRIIRSLFVDDAQGQPIAGRALEFVQIVIGGEFEQMDIDRAVSTMYSSDEVEEAVKIVTADEEDPRQLKLFGSQDKQAWWQEFLGEPLNPAATEEDVLGTMPTTHLYTGAEGEWGGFLNEATQSVFDYIMSDPTVYQRVQALASQSLDAETFARMMESEPGLGSVYSGQPGVRDLATGAAGYFENVAQMGDVDWNALAEQLLSGEALLQPELVAARVAQGTQTAIPSAMGAPSATDPTMLADSGTLVQPAPGAGGSQYESTGDPTGDLYRQIMQQPQIMEMVRYAMQEPYIENQMQVMYDATLPLAQSIGVDPNQVDWPSLTNDLISYVGFDVQEVSARKVAQIVGRYFMRAKTAQKLKAARKIVSGVGIDNATKLAIEWSGLDDVGAHWVSDDEFIEFADWVYEKSRESNMKHAQQEGEAKPGELADIELQKFMPAGYDVVLGDMVEAEEQGLDTFPRAYAHVEKNYILRRVHTCSKDQWFNHLLNDGFILNPYGPNRGRVGNPDVKKKAKQAQMGDREEGHYLIFEKDGGNLKITPTEEGIEFAQENMEGPTDNLIVEMIEDFLGGEWEVVRPEEVGALTSALLISDDVTRDDMGDLTDVGRIYYNPRYALDNELEIWSRGEPVVFEGIE